MTFRARPTTRTGRRSGHESDARRNLYFNLGFGAIVVVAILLLVGAGAASWYNDHLAPVAKVNGETITKDALGQRVALETFHLDTLESRTREKVNAGRLSASQGTQLLNFITQQKQQIASLAYEREIDTTLVLQLAPKQNVTATPAQVDAQITKDATTVESRHAYQIQVKPETSTGATAPSQAQKDAAKAKAEALVADLKAGKTWEEVVKTSGDADAADTNGDLYFLDQGATTPDAAFVTAIFALAAPGTTDAIEGSDGVLPDRAHDRDRGGRGRPQLPEAGGECRRGRGRVPPRGPGRGGPRRDRGQARRRRHRQAVGAAPRGRDQRG